MKTYKCPCEFTGHEDEEFESAYELGWHLGFNDILEENPFPPGSEDYRNWDRGYDQGREDC